MKPNRLDDRLVWFALVVGLSLVGIFVWRARQSNTPFERGPEASKRIRVDEDIVWEEQRGSSRMDQNNRLFFARAFIDEVITALKPETQQWTQDVMGQEVVLADEGADEGLFVFRLRGQQWTELVPGPRGQQTYEVDWAKN